VEAPLFVAQSGYDSATSALFAKLGCFAGHPPPECDAQQLAFAQAQYEVTLEAARWLVAQRSAHPQQQRRRRQTGLFVTACVSHTQCCDSQWTQPVVNATVRLWDAVQRWWSSSPGEDVVAVDDGDLWRRSRAEDQQRRPAIAHESSLMDLFNERFALWRATGLQAAASMPPRPECVSPLCAGWC
jgi:hypothetical protein